MRIDVLRRGLLTVLLGAALLAVPASAPAGNERWTRFGPATGNGLAFALDPVLPNTAYFSQLHGGLSKSVDGGLSWARLSALDGETVVGLSPVGSSLFAVLSGGRILRSDDHGRRWIPVYDGEAFRNLGSNNFAGVGLLAVESDLFLRSAAGVYRSRDQGESWEQVLAGSLDSGGVGGITALAADPAAPGTLYAGFSAHVGGHALFKSADGGETWQPTGVPTGGFPFNGIAALAVLPTRPSTILAASAGAGLFRSTDGGATWQSVAPATTDPFEAFFYAITPDPAAPGAVYAASQTAFWRSTDAGRTWQRQGPEPANGVFALEIDPATRILYAGSFGGVSRSGGAGGGGRRWRYVYAVNFERAFGFVRFHPTDPAVIYLTGNELYRSANAGRTWSSFGLEIGTPERPVVTSDLAFDPEDPSIVYVGAAPGIYRSRDGGRTFAELPGLEPMFVTTLALLDSRTLIAGGCGIRRSADGGETWRTVFACERPGATDESARSVLEFWVDRQTPGVVYAEVAEYEGRHPVSTYQNLYKSADGGRTWRVVLPDSSVMALDPARPRTLYAVRAEGILRSDDAGRSWRRISPFAPGIVDLQPDPLAPSTLYAASHARGVYRSTDGGVTWAPINAGLPNLVGTFRFQQMAVHPLLPHRVYLETGDGKLWQARFGG